MSKKNSTRIRNVGKFPTLETLAAKLDVVLAWIDAAPSTDAGDELIERLNRRKWKILEKIDETRPISAAEFRIKAAVFAKQRDFEGEEGGYYGLGTAESLSKSLINDAMFIMGHVQ